MYRLKGEYNNGKTRVFLNQEQLDLKKSLKLKSHSPRGFGWGYNGEATKQLSIAICQELYGNSTALLEYNNLNTHIIQHLPHQKDFEINFNDEFNQSSLKIKKSI